MDMTGKARRVTWDEAKAASNIAKHRVSFGEAEEVFEDTLSLTVFGSSRPADEERFITVGQSRRRLLTIGHADSDDEIRIITARDAARKERRDYEA